MAQQHRVLLVDNNRQRANKINSILVAYFSVELVTNTDLDLDLLNSFDIAIININFSIVKKIEITHFLYQVGLPVIFTLRENEVDCVPVLINSGAYGVLIEPTTEIHLISVVLQALKRASDNNDYREKELRLENALETGNQVNVVVGMLMERHRLSRINSYELLRKKSRTERKKVKIISEEIIESWEIFNQLIEH